MRFISTVAITREFKKQAEEKNTLTTLMIFGAVGQTGLNEQLSCLISTSPA
jgi:hypothetical protein